MHCLLTLTLLVAPAAAADGGDEPTPRKMMVNKVSKGLGCDRDALSFDYLGSETANGDTWTSWEVTGCEEPFMVSFTGGLGWGRFIDDKDLRPKAAFDLDCDAADLEVNYIDRNTRGVEGCERRVRYVHTDSAGWVANVASD